MLSPPFYLMEKCKFLFVDFFSQGNENKLKNLFQTPDAPRFEAFFALPAYLVRTEINIAIVGGNFTVECHCVSLNKTFVLFEKENAQERLEQIKRVQIGGRMKPDMCQSVPRSQKLTDIPHYYTSDRNGNTAL